MADQEVARQREKMLRIVGQSKQQIIGARLIVGKFGRGFLSDLYVWSWKGKRVNLEVFSSLCKNFELEWNKIYSIIRNFEQHVF